MLELMKNLIVEEEGQALTEYGLILGLVAVVVVLVLAAMGDEIVKIFQSIVTELKGATSTPVAT